MTVAPQDILDANEVLSRHPRNPPSYRFSGCVGDANHSFGYHLAPDDLPDSDYSLQSRRDQRGAGMRPTWASAWDLSFGPDDMRTVTHHLLAAAKRGDPRMRGVREFCGTLDNRRTYPWDLHTNSCEGIGSWDDSHLWHVHISFYRDATPAEVHAVVGVVQGHKPTLGQRLRTVGRGGGSTRGTVRFPLDLNNYYGLITGPARSHGGFYPSERPAVALIQRRLQKLGFAPRDPEWADGYFGPATRTAVESWQEARRRDITGTIDADDWKALFR